MTADGERGWVCSEDPGHFQLASEAPRREALASGAPHARWDDDGGPAPAERNTNSAEEAGAALGL